MNGSNASKGFTLIEVLVATAIIGIALGVILSSIAMGHRQAFRGDQAREAAEIADTILQGLRDNNKSIPEGSSGKIEGHPGWSYRLYTTDAAVTVQNDEMGEKDLGLPELIEIRLDIIPPGTKTPFIITDLLQSPDQKASDSQKEPSVHTPFSGGAH